MNINRTPKRKNISPHKTPTITLNNDYSKFSIIQLKAKLKELNSTSVTGNKSQIEMRLEQAKNAQVTMGGISVILVNYCLLWVAHSTLSLIFKYLCLSVGL